MKNKKEWFIEITNPKTNEIIFTIYNDGYVYGTKENIELFILNDEAFSKIKEIVKKDIYMLRTVRYLNNNKGLITRINDISRKHRNPIKVIGWVYEIQIINIIKKQLNFKKSLIAI